MQRSMSLRRKSMAQKIVLMFSFLLIFSSVGRAQSAQPEVRGVMLGAEALRSFGNTDVAGGVRWWHEYFGADFVIEFEHFSVDASGTDLTRTTGVGIAPGFLVGFPVHRLKPHFRLGFGYSYTKDSV